MGGELALPNVSLIKENMGVEYNPYVDPYNGHEYVDLGLPSGTKWATMNVGADDETGYGNYYMYGNGSNTEGSIDDYYEGTERPLAKFADTAAQVWGGSWHTPTVEQFSELRYNTTYQWVNNYNGLYRRGGLFTATNGKSIFLPAAGYYSYEDDEDTYDGELGYYWSSTPNGNHTYEAYYFSFYESNKYTDVENRYNGYSIRPVVG